MNSTRIGKTTAREIPAERLLEAAAGLAAMGLRAKAVSLARQAWERDPSSHEAALLCGDLMRAEGDLAAALACYRTFPDDLRCRYAAAVLAGRSKPQTPPGLAPAPFLSRRDFLPPELQAELCRLVASHSDKLTLARVTGDLEERLDLSARRARTMLGSAEIEALFAPALHRLIETLRESGWMDLPLNGCLTLQVTRSGVGDFYRRHRDKTANSHGYLRRRRLTFVYYLHREPRDFRGGMLRLYDREAASGRFTEQRFTQIEPCGNSIVLFAPHEVHEITPVETGPAGEKGERWTLNGWLSASANSEMDKQG